MTEITHVPNTLHDMLLCEFTTEDQQRFIANFQMHLAFGTDPSKHVVDLDHVYEWIGFTRKDNAKKVLVKNFEENNDYILLLQSQEQTRGGHNKEQIYMNIETFKGMCMIANTEKGKRTRRYYSKMETIFFKYMEQVHQDTIQTLEIENKKRMEEERHNLLVRSYADQPSVYIIKIMQENEHDMIVKLGETDDISQRIISLRQEYSGCVLLHIFPCKQPHKFEQYLFKRPDIQKQRIMGTEILQISSDFTLDFLVKLIEKNIDFFDNTPIEHKIALARIKERTQLLQLLEKTTNEEEKQVYIKLLASNDLQIEGDYQPVISHHEPESTRKVYKYALTDLKTPITSFNSLREAARSLQNTKVHDYHIRYACNNNQELEGYRWYYVDNDQTLPETIPETATTPNKKVRRNGKIAQLDKDGRKIMNVYASLKEAAVAANIASCSLTCAMNKTGICAGFHWKMYDDCDETLKGTYEGTLPAVNKATCSKQIERIDPVTNNVLETYSSIQDVCSSYRICHKTMNKITSTGDIYKGFKWRIVS